MQTDTQREQWAEAQIEAAAKALAWYMWPSIDWRDVLPSSKAWCLQAVRTAAPHLRPQGALWDHATAQSQRQSEPPAAQPVGDGELVERALEIFERHFNWRGMPGLARSGMDDVVKFICAEQRRKDADAARDTIVALYPNRPLNDVIEDFADAVRARLLAEPKTTVALPPLRICGDYYEAILAQLKEREEQLLGALTKIAELQAQAEKGSK